MNFSLKISSKAIFSLKILIITYGYDLTTTPKRGGLWFLFKAHLRNIRLGKSKDIRGVQEILGHKNIQTTQKYTHVLAREKVNIVNGIGELVAEVMEKESDDDEK